MKLRKILEDSNSGVRGPISAFGNFDPSQREPISTPNRSEKDFVDKEFELEFLDQIKEKSMPMRKFGYKILNRIKNLERSGFLTISDTEISITPEGLKWLEQFQSQQHGAYQGLQVDPGGWNPVSGAYSQGALF